MRFKENGNLADTRCIVIKNLSATQINKGCPTFFSFAATNQDRGRGVIPSESATASTGTIRSAMATADLEQNEYNDGLVYGFTSMAVVVSNSRTASTLTWASVASIASGALFVPQVGLSGVQGWVSTNGLPTTQMGVYAVAMQSFASRASQASTYGSANLGDTTGSCLMFVREM